MIYFWVQRYGVFRIPTIPILWHIIYLMYGITFILPIKKRCVALRIFNRQQFLTDASQRKNKYAFLFTFLLFYLLKVYLFIYHFSVQDLEGVEFRFSIKKRENGIADGRIISQTQVLLRGARWRSGMRMPVGKNL